MGKGTDGSVVVGDRTLTANPAKWWPLVYGGTVQVGVWPKGGKAYPTPGADGTTYSDSGTLLYNGNVLYNHKGESPKYTDMAAINSSYDAYITAVENYRDSQTIVQDTLDESADDAESEANAADSEATRAEAEAKVSPSNSGKKRAAELRRIAAQKRSEAIARRRAAEDNSNAVRRGATPKVKSGGRAIRDAVTAASSKVVGTATSAATDTVSVVSSMLPSKATVVGALGGAGTGFWFGGPIGALAGMIGGAFVGSKVDDND